MHYCVGKKVTEDDEAHNSLTLGRKGLLGAHYLQHTNYGPAHYLQHTKHTRRGSVSIQLTQRIKSIIIIFLSKTESNAQLNLG